MVNKKIRNATQSTSEGITFKSKLERSVYNTLLEQGFEPKYEPITFVIWEGFHPEIPY
jgi:ribosomal protein S8